MLLCVATIVRKSGHELEKEKYGIWKVQREKGEWGPRVIIL